MRAAVPILIATLTLSSLAGCREKTQGDVVREAYDNKAKAIDAQAEQQPTPVAKKIYRSQADALREEGKDRETGIEGGTPSKGQGGGAMVGGVAPEPGNS